MVSKYRQRVWLILSIFKVLCYGTHHAQLLLNIKLILRRSHIKKLDMRHSFVPEECYMKKLPIVHHNSHIKERENDCIAFGI